MRLTLLYGGLFLVSGAALLAITYVLVVHATRGFIFSNGHGLSGAVISGPGPDRARRPGERGFDVHSVRNPPPGGRLSPRQLRDQATQQRASQLHQLLVQSGIALAGMALVSIVLGWIVAGRVLRPLREITGAARDISANNLHERLALDGPDDELKELGDTFDALLARLEQSFDAQRRFVANASHELRTPLALNRAMLQVALADPELSLDSLRSTCEELLDAGTQHEQLIEALLTLAQSQQGLDRRETLDLAQIAEDVIETARRGNGDTTIDAALRSAPIAGDRQLVQRLVSNLVQNALKHNVPGGRVDVVVEHVQQRARLAVANTGPRVPPDQIARLLQPFQRLEARGASETDGHGLGLSIVAAIADAHQADLEITSRPEGGLDVVVSFPLARSPQVDPRPGRDQVGSPCREQPDAVGHAPLASVGRTTQHG
jgi:signal transduction histidine kinase